MKLHQPVPELPVSDVEAAQRHYRDCFACTIEWLDPSGEIGAVANGETAIFLRRRTPPFEPAVHWVYCDDLDQSHTALTAAGARIVAGIEQKPWGLRQFTVHDADGNVFHFHDG